MILMDTFRIRTKDKTMNEGQGDKNGLVLLVEKEVRIKVNVKDVNVKDVKCLEKNPRNRGKIVKKCLSGHMVL
jgi:hypothetical protein